MRREGGRAGRRPLDLGGADGTGSGTVGERRAELAESCFRGWACDGAENWAGSGVGLFGEGEDGAAAGAVGGAGVLDGGTVAEGVRNGS